jgi:nucleoside-diphosphate-sugar epimerase
MNKTWNVLVTGGAGYVGSALIPKLLDAGHNVTVLDLYLYGDDVFAGLRGRKGFREVKGDIRNIATVENALKGCDAVIHLACISNDPSFELDPTLGKAINLDAFRPLVQASKRAGVKRFVYASSSSVYGIKDVPSVTEDLALEPLTDYSKFKAMCEEILAEERAPGFVTLTLRPSTVCGYAPRLRLDLTVNILTAHAWTNREIKVFGGNQKRPNIHIADMTDLYVQCLQWEDKVIDGKIFNAGYENHTVAQLAETVRETVTSTTGGGEIRVVTTPSNDHRSYHVSSAKLERETGFRATHSIADAVRDLVEAFDAGKVPNAMTSNAYYNIKTMQAVGLS